MSARDLRKEEAEVYFGKDELLLCETLGYQESKTCPQGMEAWWGEKHYRDCLTSLPGCSRVLVMHRSGTRPLP